MVRTWLWSGSRQVWTFRCPLTLEGFLQTAAFNGRSVVAACARIQLGCVNVHCTRFKNRLLCFTRRLVGTGCIARRRGLSCCRRYRSGCWSDGGVLDRELTLATTRHSWVVRARSGILPTCRKLYRPMSLRLLGTYVALGVWTILWMNGDTASRLVNNVRRLPLRSGSLAQSVARAYQAYLRLARLEIHLR